MTLAVSTAHSQGDDIRLSDMGPDGTFLYFAGFSAVAYNPVDKEDLVVWHGSDDRDGQVTEEGEISSEVGR